ncbi:hypothetical protein V5O48_016894 [Marasmius crinis-equi]|uniref:Autophagy-related protein 14 n=1 Tax=Marasmius crinis-equi TaxID=585013 RepID=A0ABR3EQF4_9AGAR
MDWPESNQKSRDSGFAKRKRARLQELREGLATRRRALAAAKLLATTAASSELQTQLSYDKQELAVLSSNIARARVGLVQELVEVFNIVEVGGRPSVGGKAGAKGEWTIGGLILPVPGDIRRYPPDHVNAVVTNTTHFLSLLTFYLGVKLPFEVSWSGGRFGLGVPSIRAGTGGENGGWARWHNKQPLHVSANPQAPQIGLHESSSGVQLVSESYILPSPEPQQAFTTGFAMLIYNVCYLAYTQSVDIPLAQAGDVLSNLWRVCCSAELGRRSHETQPLLSAPTPSAFHLEFGQLMQAMTASRRTRGTGANREVRQVQERIDEDGWDVVEDEDF